MIRLIAAVDKNWGIGKDNKLLFRLPADMRFFKEKTLGNIVCLGRKCLDSFPNSKPLSDRTSIVLTTSKKDFNGCVTVHSLDELLKTLKSYGGKDIYIIGGEQFYKLMRPYAEEALITKVDDEAEADAFLENFDNLDGWKLQEADAPIETNGYYISFCRYKNDNPLPL